MGQGSDIITQRCLSRVHPDTPGNLLSHLLMWIKLTALLPLSHRSEQVGTHTPHTHPPPHTHSYTHTFLIDLVVQQLQRKAKCNKAEDTALVL